MSLSALRKTGGDGARDVPPSRYECVCEMHRDQGSRSDFIFILSTPPPPSPLALGYVRRIDILVIRKSFFLSLSLSY